MVCHIVLMSKGNKTFFGFVQGQFLDVIQDRVKTTIKPLRGEMKEIIKGSLSITNKRLYSCGKRYDTG